MSDYFLAVRAQDAGRPTLHLRRECRQLTKAVEVMRLDGLPSGVPICASCIDYTKATDGLTLWNLKGRPL